MEVSRTDEKRSVRGAVVRVQRHLKALAAGKDVIFKWLTLSAWRAREKARCFKRGAMVAADGNRVKRTIYIIYNIFLHGLAACLRLIITFTISIMVAAIFKLFFC